MASLSRLWVKYPWKRSGKRVRTSNRMVRAGLLASSATVPTPLPARLRLRRGRPILRRRLLGRGLGLQLLELRHVLLEEHLHRLGRLGPDAQPVLDPRREQLD